MQVLELLIERLKELPDQLNTALTMQVRVGACMHLLKSVHSTKVYTHPVQPDSRCSSQGNNCVQELSIRSTFYNLSCWSATFHDHLGTDLWFPLATTCFKELEGLIAAMDSYLEAQQQTRYHLHSSSGNLYSSPGCLLGRYS